MSRSTRSSTDHDPVPAALLDLAPLELERSSEERYAGEDFDVRLDTFAAGDVRKLRNIYTHCEGVYQAWLDERDQSQWPGVEDHLAEFRDPTFIEEAKTLGRASQAEGVDGGARAVIHDIRGGGLVGVIGLAELAAIENDTSLLREAVLLGRDHAKMMRQAVVGIDPDGRRADEREKQHDVEDVARKWERRRYHANDATARIRVDCHYQGGLASRCLEAAAVDRILYNLMNNATRFAADNEVTLTIFEIESPDIRFVVRNAIDDQHASWLRDRTDGDLGALFRGGITRGGQGIGLSNCAQLVAAAYGRAGAMDAVEGAYVGAGLHDGAFYAWFHWPTYG